MFIENQEEYHESNGRYENGTGVAYILSESSEVFALYQSCLQGALQEGSVIELAVTQPDGKKLETNLRLTASDLDLIAQIKGLIPPQ